MNRLRKTCNKDDAIENKHLLSLLYNSCKKGYIQLSACRNITKSIVELRRTNKKRSATHNQVIYKRLVSLLLVLLVILIVPSILLYKDLSIGSGKISSYGSTNSSSKRYIPEELVDTNIEKARLQILSKSDQETVAQFKGHEISLLNISVTDKTSIYYLSTTKQGSSIQLQQLDQSLHNPATVQTVFSTKNKIISATLSSYNNEVIFAYTTDNDPDTLHITRQQNGESQTTNTELLTNEDTIGMSLSKENGEYTLLTLVKNEGLTGLTQSAPILRRYNADLKRTGILALEPSRYSFDPHMVYIPKEGNAFSILATARNPFADNASSKGGDVIMASYDNNRELFKVTKLTNSGIKNELSPTNAILTNGHIIFPIIRQGIYIKEDDDKAGHPVNSGKVLLSDYKNTYDFQGSVLINDYKYYKPILHDLREGGSNPHIAMNGNRIYIAHEHLMDNDVYYTDDSLHGEIVVQWFNMSPFY